MILNYTNSLLLEIKSKKKSADKKTPKDKEESVEQFHTRIKFNRLKKELLKRRDIKIGEPKKVWGPHEGDFRKTLVKIQQSEKQELDQRARETHKLSVAQMTMKATPSKPTSPNLKGASDTVSDTHSDIVSNKKKENKTSTIKDVLPKSSDKNASNKMYKLSKGMEKSMGERSYKCGSCNFPIPRYRGKYPKHCPGCGKELIRSKK